MTFDLPLAAYALWVDLAVCTMLYAIIRDRRLRLRASSDHGRVLVLRPCTGADAHLEATLSSVVRGAVVVMAVGDEVDPAAAVAMRVCRDMPNARVVFTHAHAPNHKAAQIAAVLDGMTDEWDVLVVADADVELDADTIDRLLAPLGGRVAASWAPPVEVAPHTLGDRVSAAILDASMHAFPILSSLDTRGMVGKLFAVRRAALAQVGGFGSLVDRLGEDVELARRLDEAGYEVVAIDAVARSHVSGRSVGAVVARFARWIMVVRAQRPLLLAAYPLLLAALPLFVVAAVALVWTGHLLALPLCGVALAARVLVAAVARVRARRPLSPTALFVYPLPADVLLLAALVRALSTRRVAWRALDLRISGGRIVREREGAGDEREHGLRGAHP